MDNDNQIILKDLLIELLEKLNDGDKFLQEEIELKYNLIQPFIDLLCTVDDFPIDNCNENIYCFIKRERKIFDKYHIQDIADLVINYHKKKDVSIKNRSSIIKDYVENQSHNSNKLDTIVLNYAMNKECDDSKNIKQLILENATKEQKCSEEVLTERILKYATDIQFCDDIAKIITTIEQHKSLCINIQAILKESKLPRRDDEAYKIISSYEPYELTHCISYEMAIRNKEVIAILQKIKILTALSRNLFKADKLHKNDSASFYIIEIEEERENILKNLKTLQIKLNSNTSSPSELQDELYKLIAKHTILLEENYYMIYDRKEIIPEGMEDVLKNPNHYEPDGELSKAIEESIKNAYDPNPRYKDNYTFKDGYAIYQAGYKDAIDYDINKIFPNFKRPMREFNQTQVAFNMSLPKDEIMKYIEKIKDDYDNKNTSYKTLDQLLYGDDTRTEDKLNHKRLKDYADDFFIYDYYVQSEEEHEKKLEIIQRKLSQHHGMKVEKGRNYYELISYDDAQIKMHTPKSNQKGRSLADLVNSFQESEHIIHHLETIKLIDERYEVLKNLIDNKKYKTLIHHR